MKQYFKTLKDRIYHYKGTSRGSFILALGLVVFAIVPFTVVVFVVQAGDLQSHAIYFSTDEAGYVEDVRSVVSFTPSEDLGAGGTFEVLFADDDDGGWCRTAGEVDVRGVDQEPYDKTGTNLEIDAELPGTLSATCVVGSGVGDSDRIIVTGLGALTSGTVYGVRFESDVATLGLDPVVGTHQIDFRLTQGIVVDTGSVFIILQPPREVAVTAIVDETSFPPGDPGVTPQPGPGGEAPGGEPGKKPVIDWGEVDYDWVVTQIVVESGSLETILTLFGFTIEQFESLLVKVVPVIIPVLLLNLVGAYTVLTLSMDISIVEINVIMWKIHNLFIVIFSRGKELDPLDYVYDTKSKEPLENAVVRVYSRSGRIVRSFITDKYGQFYGELEGEYSLRVIKHGYLFPTSLKSGFGDYLHKEFYIGGIVDFKEFDVIKRKFEKDEIFLPIPGDKSYKRSVLIVRTLSALLFSTHIPFLFMGGLLGFLVYLYLPTVQTFAILVVYFVMLLNFVFYIIYERHRYGILKDVDKKPVIGKLIQLYDKDGALYATRVTNEYGKFRFIVPKGKYSYHVDGEMIAITKDHKVMGIGKDLTLADGLALKPT